MYIKVTSVHQGYFGDRFQWLLLSHTGLVLARSDAYKRHQDAARIGKQVAKRLQIDFRGDF